MARYLGPKHKLSRREGVNLTGTQSASLQRRLEVPPGGQRNLRRKRESNYAAQLRAKQRVKREYGLLEKQFHRFFDQARKMPGVTGTNLLQLLERRLDNTVYRLDLAPTRAAGRQLVGHRHVLVNGEVINIPSYSVRPGDVISLSPKAQRMPMVQQRLQDGHPGLPSWLTREGAGGRVTGLPRREDSSADIEEALVVEFYAR